MSLPSVAVCRCDASALGPAVAGEVAPPGLTWQVRPSVPWGIRSLADAPNRMEAKPQTELDLAMARLGTGERSAFTRVFELLWPPIQRLCLALLNNEADAADAAQEAMKRIFERASDYEPARPALPWALAIAGWECRTLARKRQRRREAPEASEALPASDDTEALLVQQQLIRAALDALGQLSDTDRESLVSTFWEEAASVAGPTLRKRRQRALERLRDAFRRLYGF